MSCILFIIIFHSCEEVKHESISKEYEETKIVFFYHRHTEPLLLIFMLFDMMHDSDIFMINL